MVQGAPAVSLALIAYLDRCFATPRLLPGKANLSDHLIYQHGIDAVKDHLRMLNAEQENAVRNGTSGSRTIVS